jgi:hypothetical protein
MKDTLQTQLINFLLKQDACMRIIEHDGNYYHTSEKMKAMGLKCCQSCGYIMPIEKENCKCGERVYVMKPPDPHRGNTALASVSERKGNKGKIFRNKQGKRLIKIGSLSI